MLRRFKSLLGYLAAVFTAAAFLGLFCGACLAAETGSPLITHDDPVAMPGVGRIIFGFVVTIAVGVGVIYGLRRWLPAFATRYSTGGKDVSVQTTVQGGLRIHVVTVEHNKYLIVEGKTGIAITPVPSASTSQSSS